MTKVQIDVASDVICPWCFLGKRRLDKALVMLSDIQTEVVFRPFFLDPTIPPEGLGRHEYLVGKFGEERLATLHDPLEAAGKEDGVPYAFDKITRTPNTLNAHRLLRWALVAGQQPAIAEALFMAYWNQGRDIGDNQVLASIAGENGMDSKSVLADLETDKDKQAVIAEVQQAQRMRITGVPTFILQRKYGVVGAQPVATLVEAIRSTAAEVS